MSYTPITEIRVGLNFTGTALPVGRLALREGQIYFEYDRSFLPRGLELSPLRLPLQGGVRTFDRFLFEGLPGLFNDSLPDGWGRLLLDRSIRQQGRLPGQFSPLDRLAHVGEQGFRGPDPLAQLYSLTHALVSRVRSRAQSAHDENVQILKKRH